MSSEKYCWYTSYSLKNLFRQEISEFQRFKIVYLCTMGYTEDSSPLAYGVLSMSLLCFIVTKIALCLCWFGRWRVWTTRPISRGSAARIEAVPDILNFYLALKVHVCGVKCAERRGKVLICGRGRVGKWPLGFTMVN